MELESAAAHEHDSDGVSAHMPRRVLQHATTADRQTDGQTMDVYIIAPASI